jgi:hypothetical protein
MSSPDIPRGKYMGKLVGARAMDEAEHFIRCPTCGGWIDCRDLACVFEHEEPLPHSDVRASHWRIFDFAAKRRMAGPRLAAVIGALFVCFLLGFANEVRRASQQSPPQQQNRPPQPTGAQHDQLRAEHNQSGAGHVVTAQNVGHNQSSHGSEESNDKNWGKIFLDHLPDWFVALFTAVLSVFTGLLWWSTRLDRRLTFAWSARIAPRRLAPRNASQMKFC